MTLLSTDKMIAEKEGPIGWITFNNPARHNAVSISMWQALAHMVQDYASDDSLRVVVLKGAGGKAFVSGADISEFEQERSTPASTQAYRQAAHGATQALQCMDKPTIALIQGYCVGGGVSLALSCDLRIAAEGARFGVPAAKLGLGYEYEGVKKLVDVVGPSFAKEIFYTGRQFSAAEALAMGLVNRIVADDALKSYVQQYCDAIAANAPLTVSSIKTLVAQAMQDESARDMALCQRVVDACFNSEDYVEGRRAFMEKRKPVFRGR
jgi:enoyl-CoA hydratase/carnithine racemase